MLKYGQGVTYTQGLNGKKFREIAPESVKDIIKNYYEVHISTITQKITQSENPIIIDCHSFSDEAYECSPFTYHELPDVCIGYNHGDCKSERLALFLADYWQGLGFSASINAPYAGAYQIGSNPAVMIEINKRIYLYNDFLTKKSDFYKIKSLTKGAITQVEKFIF